jgi:hypothetical protein
MKRLQHLTYALVMLVFAINLRGQTIAKIQNTNISLDYDRIIITYDLVDAKPGERFEVWLRISDAEGQLIQGQNFSGDIGKNIEGGEGLVIYWNFEQDHITISEEINIQVMAEAQNKQELSYAEALALSTVVPGWGLAKMEKKRLYCLTGLAGYGSLALSLVYAFSSKELYDDYSNSNQISERASLYNDYIRQKNRAEVFGWSAATIWLADIIWMTVRYGKSRNYKSPSASTNVSLGCTYYMASGTPVFSMNIKF